MHAFSRTVLPAYYLSPNMKTNSSNTLLYTSNSFNLWWRNISAIYRFLVLRSVIFLFPIASPSLPGLAWPPACLPAGRPAHLSSQPADCQHSQAALKSQEYRNIYYTKLSSMPPSAYHIPPVKKSCENHACDFTFSLKWHGNNLMKWQQKKMAICEMKTWTLQTLHLWGIQWCQI